MNYQLMARQLGKTGCLLFSLLHYLNSEKDVISIAEELVATKALTDDFFVNDHHVVASYLSSRLGKRIVYLGHSDNPISGACNIGLYMVGSTTHFCCCDDEGNITYDPLLLAPSKVKTPAVGYRPYMIS